MLFLSLEHPKEPEGHAQKYLGELILPNIGLQDEVEESERRNSIIELAFKHLWNSIKQILSLKQQQQQEQQPQDAPPFNF